MIYGIHTLRVLTIGLRKSRKRGSSTSTRPLMKGRIIEDRTLSSGRFVLV